MRVTTACVWTSIGHSPCVAQLVQGRPVEPCRGDPDMDRLVPQERCRTNADLPIRVRGPLTAAGHTTHYGVAA
jgi:hypothetical protein